MNLVNNRLDCRVFDHALKSIAPNCLGMHYGVDDNKIQGISSFPVFSNHADPKIHAKPSAEEFIYTKKYGEKYSVGKVTHHSPPSVKGLYNFTNIKNSYPNHSRNGLGGLTYKWTMDYGLPEFNLTFDNYAAREKGVVGMTETEFARKNWREEVKQETGETMDTGLPEGIENVINANGERRRVHPDPPVPAGTRENQRRHPVVASPAFEPVVVPMDVDEDVPHSEAPSRATKRTYSTHNEPPANLLMNVNPAPRRVRQNRQPDIGGGPAPPPDIIPEPSTPRATKRTFSRANEQQLLLLTENGENRPRRVRQRRLGNGSV